MEQRENRKEYFDKNEDGKLGPHERKTMHRVKNSVRTKRIKPLNDPRVI